jgi:hypothetical protein
MVRHCGGLANDSVAAALYSRAELQFVREESIFRKKIVQLIDTSPPNDKRWP